MSSMFVTEGNLVRIVEYEYHNSCLLTKLPFEYLLMYCDS